MTLVSILWSLDPIHAGLKKKEKIDCLDVRSRIKSIYIYSWYLDSHDYENVLLILHNVIHLIESAHGEIKEEVISLESIT